MSDTVKTYILPIYWQQTKKKKVLAGMNNYRNWDYFTSSKFKRDFTQLLLAQIESPPQKPAITEYTLHLKLFYKNSNCDGSNIIALMEKVALDTFQTAGLVSEDRVINHLGSTWEIAGQDKINPRCEIQIKEIV